MIENLAVQIEAEDDATRAGLPALAAPLSPDQRTNAITFGFQSINDAEDAMKRGDFDTAKRHTADAVRCSKLLQNG